MIRPSQLSLADAGCGLAAALAADNPEGSTATEAGKDMHALLEAGLKGKRTAAAPIADQIIALIRAHAGNALVQSEAPVELRDPCTDELITAGTCDVRWVVGNRLYVLDLKTGQPAYLPPIDESMQLHAYALGSGLELGCEEYVIGYALVEPEPHLEWSRIFFDVDWAPMLERIKRAASRPPVPVVGPHCLECWQRKRCPSWLLPAYQGESALVPFTQPAGLTKDNAAKALLAVGAIKTALKIAEAQLEDFARQNGGIEADGRVWGPVIRQGRRSISVTDVEKAGKLGELEAAGLVKRSQPYEVFQWSRKGGR